MPRTSPLRPLSGILDADPTLASWNARRRRDEAIAASLCRHLPRAMAASLRIADTSDATLEVATPSGAIAAAVRQRTPDLLAALQGEGWKFTGLRVVVQPRAVAQGPGKVVYRQRDKSMDGALSRLESGLPPGPLKAALGHWLRGSRGRAGGG